jgi:hypothetical protein
MLVELIAVGYQYQIKENGLLCKENFKKWLDKWTSCHVHFIIVVTTLTKESITFLWRGPTTFNRFAGKLINEIWQIQITTFIGKHSNISLQVVNNSPCAFNSMLFFPIYWT